MLRVAVSCLINCASVRLRRLFLAGAAKIIAPQDFDRGKSLNSELANRPIPMLPPPPVHRVLPRSQNTTLALAMIFQVEGSSLAPARHVSRSKAELIRTVWMEI